VVCLYPGDEKAEAPIPMGAKAPCIAAIAIGRAGLHYRI
jgi:hypothetical protein